MAVTLEHDSEPIPGYRLVKPLGQGGFGEVWEAKAPGGMRVALKFIPTDNGNAVPELRAIEAMRNVRHPHLLEMHFAMQVENYLIIATSLCDKSLWDRYRECVSNGADGIPIDELLVYMEETARAVDFLNEPRHLDGYGQKVSIQHRDIKPHNIFLVGDSVKVGDFGLAKYLESHVTTRTSGMTPHYAPPERFKRSIAKTSDQYSLAVSYCQLRIGRLPFSGSTLDIVYAHVHEPPDLDRLFPDEVPIVTRALSKEPTERWSCCRDFVDALKKALDGSRLLIGNDSGVSLGRSRNSENSLIGHAHEYTRIPPERSGSSSVHSLPKRAGFIPFALSLLILSLAIVAAFVRSFETNQLRLLERDSVEHVNTDGKLKVVANLKRPLDHQGDVNDRQTSSESVKSPGNASLVVEFFPKDDPCSTEAQKQSTLDSLIEPKPSVIWRRQNDSMTGSIAGDQREFGDLQLAFCWCPAGNFTMGSPESEPGRHHNEDQVEVTLTKGFWLGKYEVLQSDYERVVGSNPSYFSSKGEGNNRIAGINIDYLPVERVSWDEANSFCARLSEMDHRAGWLPPDWEYRLPTEAQWEYACRAGSTTAYSFGDNPRQLSDYAWWGGNMGDRTMKPTPCPQPVGKKLANAWNLHDMHGSVWEWCRDWYIDKLPGGVDPEKTEVVMSHVRRGGCWVVAAGSCRSANRDDSTGRSSYLGFRVALVQD